MVGMRPIPGVRLTVISDVSEAPYSGMLPGHIAGFYSRSEVHIDLRKLCQFAGARFVLGKVTGIDPNLRLVQIEGRPPMRYDLASINIGSAPSWGGVPGAEEFATPSKPVPELLGRWEQILAKHDAKKEAGENPEEIAITIVGGGAGGVEMALGIERRLEGFGKITLIHGGSTILQTHNERVQKRLNEILNKRAIRVLTSTRVSEVEIDHVTTDSGERIPSDETFWVTNAKAPEWLADSGFQCDEHGFVRVKNTLQAVGFPNLFATGDVASIDGYPRPKSGVFAVRMAKPLLRNLRLLAADKPPVSWSPQKEFLSLIGTSQGSGSAVASRQFLAWESPLMWRWKNQIDRKFMRRFTDLPAMDGAEQDDPQAVEGNDLESLRRRASMRCSGCAAKVGSPILSRVMSRIRELRADSNSPSIHAPQIIAGIDDPDDAAILDVPAGKHLVQTIDYIPEIVGDPFVFGRIAANHCMSDIFAMGADAHSALCLVVVPFGAEQVIEETLFQALGGLTHALDSMGVPLAGGHTAEGAVLALGINANGFVDRDHASRKGGMRPGDAVILTKALGTGCLFAAEMRFETDPRWIDRATESMLLDNLSASKILREHGATAMTDVTGFGLLGHLAEMLKAQPAEAAFAAGTELSLECLPILDGAIEVSQRGILSSLHRHNRSALEIVANAAEHAEHDAFPLLVDPQTSGGLLAGVPEDRAEDVVAALTATGYLTAARIGTAIPEAGVRLEA